MKLSVAWLCLLFCLSPGLAQIPESSSQLLVVTSGDWSELHAQAQRYERRVPGFVKVGRAFPVVLGDHGLGWGRGLAGDLPHSGPRKQEGDRKSPAGLFALGTAFGYDATVATRLPYLPLSRSIECVDDAKSGHYNQLVDSRDTSRDWSSSEQMRRDDELYRYGVFVEHNWPATPNAGSCIFMHVWENADGGTVGCTAMDQGNILVLLQWLDPDKQPLLVQMPRAIYQQQRRHWHLPKL
jgi:L,D-peptidoglycan transpeptidase YkuD (ErfK/YbiS/YcfS/YnhG family)